MREWKLLKRLSLVLGAGALTVLALEGCFRMAGVGAVRFLQPGPEYTRGQALSPRSNRSQPARFFHKTFPLPVHPPAGVRRVFVFGGSAAQGFPYPQYSFASFFEAARNASQGKPALEAVNLGGLQFALRDVRQLFEELLRNGARPDAVVIHSGNNELFYNRVRILRECKRTGIWSALFSVSQLAKFVRNRLPQEPVPRDAEALSRAWPLNESNLRLLLAAYQADLQRIMDRCRKENIPLVLTTLPINRDFWAPAFSGGDSLKKLARQGAAHFQNGALGKARKCFEQVTATSPDEPLSNFYLGRILEREKKLPEARRYFERALRNDQHRPIRTLPAFNDIVRQAQGPGVYLLDFDQHFLDKYGLDGRKLFIDNCHGKLETYLEMGVLLAQFFVENKIFPALPVIPSGPILLPRLRKGLQITEKDLERLHAYVNPILEPGIFKKEYEQSLHAYELELRKERILR